ncbi:MAG: CapA family protein, partial [bacterium]
DLAIGNLEFTLPGKPPYSGYPQFRSPDSVAIALKEAGFDLLVTANNHSNDAGKTGVEHPIHTVRKLGVHQTGTFLDSLDQSQNYPLLIQHGNFKLAFLNYTYGTNGIPTKAPVIVNLIDEKQIALDMQKARG